MSEPLSWMLEGEPTPGDRGMTHGLGVFETMLAVDGEIRHLDWHWERLEAGCARLDLDPPSRPAVMESLTAHLLEGCWRVRLARTAGAGALNELRGRGARTVLTVAPCPEPPVSLRVITAPWPRNEHAPLCGIKCLSYAENLLALDAARRAGVDEAIFFNTQGELCEGATSNVYVQKEGRLLTPPLSSGCLPGVLRRSLLESGAATEAVLFLDEVREAERVFLSSATRGLVPVAEWQGL